MFISLRELSKNGNDLGKFEYQTKVELSLACTEYVRKYS